jgi:hypothetical protein
MRLPPNMWTPAAAAGRTGYFHSFSRNIVSGSGKLKESARNQCVYSFAASPDRIAGK